MKIFFVTFTCFTARAWFGETQPSRIMHRMLFAQLAGKFTWVRYHRDTANPFGVPSRDDVLVRDMIADRCNAPMYDDENSGAMRLEGAVQLVCDGKFTDVQDIHITEVTPLQYQWLWRGEGKYIGRRLFEPFYQFCRASNRINGLYRRIMAHFEYDSREEGLFGAPRDAGQRATFHGCSVYRASFIHRREFFAELGSKVREAIRDDDATDLVEHIIDYADPSTLGDWSRTLSNIRDALSSRSIDFGVQLCDCGHFERDEDVHQVGRRGESSWCDSCFDDDAVYVEDRSEYWPRDDAYYHEGADAYYSYEEDEEESDDEEEPSNLMSYSTNVLRHVEPDRTIHSSPTGNFLMGIEFEMITEGRVHEAVDDVREELGTEYCVCKSDGSLSDGGLEIVTAPRGLAEHITRFKKWTVNSDYRAWDKKCCGMHIHIDSHAFTQMTLGKFLMFINAEGNTDFIRKIAGRHANRDEQARNYCAAEHQTTLSNPKQAIKGKSTERYRMVNLQNLRSGAECKRLGFEEYQYGGQYNTVELRIFRASLKKERLLAQIEFTHAAVMFCRVASWRELNEASFLKFLKSSSSLYPNLADWYGVRRRVAPCLTGKQTTCQDQPEPVTEGD